MFVLAVMLALVLATTALPPAMLSAASGTDPTPVVTDNVFLPDDQNLTDCLGSLERPGCGSEARGGWGQTAVFIAMALGLCIIFGRILWAVYRGRDRRRAAAPAGNGTTEP